MVASSLPVANAHVDRVAEPGKLDEVHGLKEDESCQLVDNPSWSSNGGMQTTGAAPQHTFIFASTNVGWTLLTGTVQLVTPLKGYPQEKTPLRRRNLGQIKIGTPLVIDFCRHLPTVLTDVDEPENVCLRRAKECKHEDRTSPASIGTLSDASPAHPNFRFLLSGFPCEKRLTARGTLSKGFERHLVGPFGLRDRKKTKEGT